MEFKCSECGGKITTKKNDEKLIYKCIKCGREKVVKLKITETVDLSENANLDVIME
jgi:DNA-directed RNA polymerase subunit RPC12/RpoP